MFKNLHKRMKNENGVVVIVEAAFVFPIMFVILFVLIYMGNIYYIRSSIDAIAQQYAIKGASYCVDPNLASIQAGKVPNVENIKTEPYRYFIGGMSDEERTIENEVIEAVKNSGVSIFKSMNPQITNTNIAKFNNFIVYSTFSVQIDYTFRFPIKLPGADDWEILKYRSRAEVPVDDSAEFIRNVDMVIDMFHNTKIGISISSAFNKINEFLTYFTKS
ncbi:MAG: TadE/TadG family type IV pilus assembly protein [Lachnospiraceae bacterium]